MCTFCDNIYPEDDTSDILFGRGKYKNIAQGGSFIYPDTFITVNEDGELDIVADSGDPYEIGYVCDIKFCPYCGRNLKEPVGIFHCGVEESERCHEEAIIESEPHAIQRIRDEILKARKEMKK